MDAATFFLLRYDVLHGLMTQALLADLKEEQFRARPHGQNSIAWLLWHAARAEDIGVNRFGMDRQQVFDRGWGDKMGWRLLDVGTAMPSEEVDALSRSISMPALIDYWNAVAERTREVVRKHNGDGWERTVDPGLIKRIVHDEGCFRPEAAWTEQFYQEQPRGWAFAHFALTHSFGHFYEANVVRGMLGLTGR